MAYTFLNIVDAEYLFNRAYSMEQEKNDELLSEILQLCVKAAGNSFGSIAITYFYDKYNVLILEKLKEKGCRFESYTNSSGVYTIEIFWTSFIITKQK